MIDEDSNDVFLHSRGNLAGCVSRRIERRAESGVAQGGAPGLDKHVTEHLVRPVGDYRLLLPY